MEAYGQEIKAAVEEAKRSEDVTDALKTLKASLTKHVESSYNYLDMLFPLIPEGEGKRLLDGAQTDIIHISESLDSVFNLLLGMKARSTDAANDAAGRLAGLTRSIDVEEVQAVLDHLRSNGQRH